MNAIPGTDPVQQRIHALVTGNPLVLFMKGTAQFPMCGFSGAAVQVLRALDVPFTAVNVLDDEAIRQGIKTYGNWPTLPQLYIAGELIGGSDIVRELYASGELRALADRALGRPSPAA